MKNHKDLNQLSIGERLKKLQRKINQNSEPTEERKREILKARTFHFAQAQSEEKENLTCLDALVFLLKNEKNVESYAAESSYVMETLPFREITPIPCTPSFVLGMINVRGKILSVLDLKQILGFSSSKLDASENNKIIIACYEDMEMCLLVDQVVGVMKFSLEQIQTSTNILSSTQKKYFKGITEDPIVILDFKNLLCDKDLIVHEEV